MDEQYYYKIGTSNVDVTKILAVANDSSEWIIHNSFETKSVSINLLEEDPFVKWTIKKYEHCIGFVILKYLINQITFIT